MKKLFISTILLIFQYIITFGQDTAMHSKVYNFTTFASEVESTITGELNNLTPVSFRSHPEYGKIPYNAQVVIALN